jgi:hypothetical protein
VAQRKLNHFTDLSHLLAAATNIIVANLVEVVLFFVSLKWLTLAVNDCVLRDDTVLRRIDLDYFEFDLPHTTTDCEEIALADGSVCLAEVGSKENIKERSCDALHCVGDRENGDALGLYQTLALYGKSTFQD